MKKDKAKRKGRKKKIQPLDIIFFSPFSFFPSSCTLITKSENLFLGLEIWKNSLEYLERNWIQRSQGTNLIHLQKMASFCETCGPYTHSQKTHQEYHQSEMTVKYTNGKAFGDSQNSKILTRTVPSPEGGKHVAHFQCPECEETSPTPSAMARHWKAKHDCSLVAEIGQAFPRTRGARYHSSWYFFFLSYLFFSFFFFFFFFLLLFFFFLFFSFLLLRSSCAFLFKSVRGPKKKPLLFIWVMERTSAGMTPCSHWSWGSTWGLAKLCASLATPFCLAKLTPTWKPLTRFAFRRGSWLPLSQFEQSRRVATKRATPFKGFSFTKVLPVFTVITLPWISQPLRPTWALCTVERKQKALPATFSPWEWARQTPEWTWDHLSKQKRKVAKTTTLLPWFLSS